MLTLGWIYRKFSSLQDDARFVGKITQVREKKESFTIQLAYYKTFRGRDLKPTLCPTDRGLFTLVGSCKAPECYH